MPLVTASVNFIDNTDRYLATINYYDDYGRVIKSFAQHYASSSVEEGNYDEISNTYSFAGELESSTRVHHKTGAANTTIAMNYEYDAWGRKVRTREKINAGDQVLLSENLYSEIGRVKEKKLHNGLQSTSFTYNQRGWLKTKTSSQFSELLKYEDGTTPQYNGNISNQNWGFAATTPNVFTYTYDGLNRLTNAAATNLSEAITYDSMGNILTMNRNGSSGSYTYDGNRLIQITGALATQPYVYDSAGNMKTDGRNGVLLTYTMDGLPKTVAKTGLSMTYQYDSQGNKLQKTSNATGAAVTTRYVGGIQYTGSNIDFIQTEEGVARRNGANYSYEYNLTDHLGNVRVTFNRNPTTGAIAILQKDDYFAFGKRSVVQGGSNKYLYNGKELQEELEMYDYGARFYDPVIGRFTTVDNLAEEMRSHSPYNYGLNNPVRFTDPDGNAPTDIILLGANNSSITIETELIDIKVNASSLGVDFGGNHSLAGDDILQAGLDIAGVVDPTGVADGLNASLSASKGNWLDAGISALGVIPFAGDLAKAGKIKKDINIIEGAVETLSKAEQRAAKLSKVAREGEDFTKAGKEAVIDVNKVKNEGKVICESCKIETKPATQSRKGVTPSKAERQVDHVKAKSKGGSGTPDNGQVLCRDCNIKKSNN